MTVKIQTLGIIGVGLIGGSFALGLKHAGKVQQVLGYGRDEKSIAQARALGLIDQSVSIEEIAEKADVIVIATPVKAFADICKVLVSHLNERAIVSDVGSTKAEVIRQAREVFGDKIAQFVPAHPIAGSHTSGPTAAIPDLFQNRNVILTPLVENKTASVELMSELWQYCGANVQILADGKDHDDIFAAVSHFPHFLASSYMSFMESDPVRQQALKMGGTGFRDFTRIAAGSPEMWRDIFLSNQEAMLEQMTAFEKEFAYIRGLLENKDAEGLYDWLDKAAKTRKEWKLLDS